MDTDKQKSTDWLTVVSLVFVGINFGGFNENYGFKDA